MASFDLAVFNYIHGLAGYSRLLDFIGIFFAEYSGYAMIMIFLVWVFWSHGQRQRFQILLFILLSLIISRGILTEAIRFIYHRPRPFNVLDFSPLIEQIDKGAFPSGHAAFYFVFAAVIWMRDRRLGNYFLAVAALMGMGRVFAGVHWPMDIIGGGLVAFASVYVVKLLLASSQPALEGSDESRILG